MTPSLSELWKDFQTPFGKALLAYYLAMATVGLLIPDDVLRSYSWARDLTDWMSGIVPQIDRIAALGIAPDVNRFYFSVLWAGFPLLTILCLGNLNEGRVSAKASIWVMPLSRAIGPAAFALFASLWGGYGLWAVDPSMKLSDMLFGNRIGRALVGQLVFHIGPTFFGIGFVVLLLGWLTGYIPRNISRIQNG